MMPDTFTCPAVAVILPATLVQVATTVYQVPWVNVGVLKKAMVPLGTAVVNGPTADNVEEYHW